MTEQKRQAITGALGGALIGILSMIPPVLIRSRLPYSVAIFVLLGLSAMGALFGYMNATARPSR